MNQHAMRRRGEVWTNESWVFRRNGEWFCCPDTGQEFVPPLRCQNNVIISPIIYSINSFIDKMSIKWQIEWNMSKVLPLKIILMPFLCRQIISLLRYLATELVECRIKVCLFLKNMTMIVNKSFRYVWLVLSVINSLGSCQFVGKKKY